ncbi:MAG: hypothetical protein WD648_14505 [Planctomycetaceae bacterium]
MLRLIPVLQCMLILGLTTGAARAADAKADAPAGTFRAGAFAIDITPTEFPISSNGSMQDRMATRAHDPLHARCLVLDDGKLRIAFAVCDSCMIPRELFDAAKQLAFAKTGIPVERMLMSATHAHSAVTVAGVFQSEPNVAYQKFLVERIAEGIERANKNLEPARVGWAVGSEPSQVFNRRWFIKAGKPLRNPFGGTSDRVQMNPPAGSDALDKPAGPVDPQIGLLSVQAVDGLPIALLANYSLHYVGGVPADALSTDYFGEFAQRMSQLLKATNAEPPFVGIMSNGTSGNINNINFTLKSSPSREPFEQIQYVAATVAAAAQKAYRNIEYHDRVPLAMREREIELGVRLPSPEDVARAETLLQEAGPGPYKSVEHIYARETVLLSKYPATVKTKLQAIRVGDLGIASSPCETFVETGLEIKQLSPFATTFTIELANGYNGYLPTPEHHALGGYETWRARSSYLATDAEPKIRETLLKLLREVASQN